MPEKISFQMHLNKVKDRYKNTSLSHDKAYQEVSCDYGIEQLKLKKVNELELAKIDEDLLKKMFENSNYNAFDNYYRLLLIE